MQAKLWTINALAIELERDRRTMAKALEGLAPDSEHESGGRVTREWRLARVFAHLHGSGEALDGNQERARKDKEQADKLAMENSLRRGQLALMPVVVTAWAEHVAAARAKLLSMPTKLGPQLVNVADPNIVATRIRTEVHAAIDELAQWEPSEVDADLQGFDESAGDLEEPAAANGKPVGRRKAQAQ